jgi:hypothetical protein
MLGLVLSLPLVVPAPAAAQDDYWTNHWNWYDNTYRPYYYRSYSYSPGYRSYGPAYGGYGNYYGPGYSNYGYGNYGYGTPYRNYYGTGDFGYGRTYGGGQAVNIGGMTFGWR